MVREAASLLVSIGDGEAENTIVRAAQRHGFPVFVADRALVSDFRLIEFLDQRSFTAWRPRAMTEFAYPLSSLRWRWTGTPPASGPHG